MSRFIVEFAINARGQLSINADELDDAKRIAKAFIDADHIDQLIAIIKTMILDDPMYAHQFNAATLEIEIVKVEEV